MRRQRHNALRIESYDLAHVMEFLQSDERDAQARPKHKCNNDLEGAVSPEDRACGKLVTEGEYTFEPRCQLCTKYRWLCRRSSLSEKCQVCEERRRKCVTIVPEGVTPGREAPVPWRAVARE